MAAKIPNGHEIHQHSDKRPNDHVMQQNVPSQGLPKDVFFCKKYTIWQP
jgi:hypothetical protein